MSETLWWKWKNLKTLLQVGFIKIEMVVGKFDENRFFTCSYNIIRIKPVIRPILRFYSFLFFFIYFLYSFFFSLFLLFYLCFFSFSFSFSFFLAQNKVTYQNPTLNCLPLIFIKLSHHVLLVLGLGKGIKDLGL